jgi:hypothetical protein
LIAAIATFALKPDAWFRRGLLLMLSPDSRANLARCQAEAPLIALCRFPKPALTAHYSGPCAAGDLRLADEWEAQARTKQLPSTRTEIGAGGELIDREKVGSHLVDTVAHPDYVTAEASRDRLALASEAGSLSLALDAADTIQAQDSLEKMLIHQMAVLHCGMMRATA